jgi:hypothetical protein
MVVRTGGGPMRDVGDERVAVGSAVSHTPGVAMARWALWVRGRIRTRIEIADGGDDAVADLTLERRRGRGGGYAIARDGGRWDVRTALQTVDVGRDGVGWFHADGSEATHGGERLSWDREGDSARRATVRRLDGSVVVRMRPGEGRRGPFATIDVDLRAGEVVPVVLGVSFVLLQADAIYGSYSAGGGGGGGGP